jgi:hypothetical protein
MQRKDLVAIKENDFPFEEDKGIMEIEVRARHKSYGCIPGTYCSPVTQLRNFTVMWTEL